MSTYYTMIFRKGKHLFNDYVVVKQLASGANGVVVEAIKNNHFYAIKIQNINGIWGDTNKTRYELVMNEINILQHIPNNKYFIPFIEYYVDNENQQAYIVTELLNNYISLSEYIKKYNYTRDVMFNISRQLCESMYLLHKSNIVHGDFFPKNIMICPNKLTIKVIDFGASYLLGNVYFNKYFKSSYSNSLDSIKKQAKIEDLSCLGMTIYTLFTYGREFQEDYINTMKICGDDGLFEQKKIIYELINATHLSDEFYEIAKHKKYKYYKSISILLKPLCDLLSEYLTNNFK